MSQMPPTVSDSDFVAIDIVDEEEIKKRFGGFVRSLHDYLNHLSCLRDIQQVRRRWKSRVANAKAFGNLASEPRHWYTFHHGGRTEAQFNIGLFKTHLRIGLGFEFTLKKGGDPTKVHLAYAAFTSIVRSEHDQFERMVRDNQLEIEWVGSSNGVLQFVPTQNAVHWLLNPAQEPQWIFAGRLLRRGHDSTMLGDAERLSQVMQRVLCGFRPIWERTQLLAHSP